MNTTPLRYVVTAAVSVAVAVALAGCGGSTGSAGADHGSMPGMTSTSPTSPGSSAGSSASAGHNQTDVSFVTTMIPHHEQAVTMAGLALTQASNAQVKALAADIKAAQDPEIKTMAGWLTGWGQPVPTGMSGMAGHDTSGMGGMAGMMMSEQEMQQLQASPGAAFDRMWLQMMTKHHQGAVTMATTQTQQGSNADAKALAMQIITAQNKEIATMAQLLPTITG